MDSASSHSPWLFLLKVAAPIKPRADLAVIERRPDAGFIEFGLYCEVKTPAGARRVPELAPRSCPLRTCKDQAAGGAGSPSE